MSSVARRVAKRRRRRREDRSVSVLGRLPPDILQCVIAPFLNLTDLCCLFGVSMEIHDVLTRPCVWAHVFPQLNIPWVAMQRIVFTSWFKSAEVSFAMLSFAARHGQTDVVHALLQHHRFGMYSVGRLLQGLVSCRRMKVLRVFVPHQQVPLDDDNWYILRITCARGQLTFLKQLLALERVQPSWETGVLMLERAATNGHLAVVRFLLTQPWIQLEKHTNGIAYVTYYLGHMEIVKELLKHRCMWPSHRDVYRKYTKIYMDYRWWRTAPLNRNTHRKTRRALKAFC